MDTEDCQCLFLFCFVGVCVCVCVYACMHTHRCFMALRRWLAVTGMIRDPQRQVLVSCVEVSKSTGGNLIQITLYLVPERKILLC